MLNKLLEEVDQYCERTSNTFFSEPLNLVSNIAFLIAGILLLKFLKQFPENKRPYGSTHLAYLIVIISLGSAAFHSFATRWAMILDVVPIGVFLLAYLHCFFRVIAKTSNLASIACLLIFLLLSLTIAILSDKQTSNGSELYYGTWVALFGICCFMFGAQKPKPKKLMIVTLLAFTVSLLCRTIDQGICSIIPIGSHFIWHSLNGVALYCATKSLVIYDLQDQQLEHVSV